VFLFDGFRLRTRHATFPANTGLGLWSPKNEKNFAALANYVTVCKKQGSYECGSRAVLGLHLFDLPSLGIHWKIFPNKDLQWHINSTHNNLGQGKGFFEAMTHRFCEVFIGLENMRNHIDKERYMADITSSLADRELTNEDESINQDRGLFLLPFMRLAN
jgi:hypothetical protein